MVSAFIASPPVGFAVSLDAAGTPAFDADFDLLTTADESLRQRIERLPGYRFWARWLRWRTTFVGTTVSEYALFPDERDAAQLLTQLKSAHGRRHRLTIIKDIPQSSPLLHAAENAHADALCSAAVAAGFVIVEGQALAYVPIDFRDIDAYLARVSASRRKDIRRKLRSRSSLCIEAIPAGSACFSDAAVVAEFQDLFDEVYAQSEVHFDCPQRAYFSRLFGDAQSGGMIFTYRCEGRLIGWNLCYESGGRLIDKYVGFRYPDARTHNLYAVSWMHNLDYAIRRGLTHYVAGWTDPKVKAQLGATFTFTRHAVYARSRLLRFVLRRLSTSFESDRQWHDESVR
ncbi:MAG: GNAT family N-acetyltransferase [Dokdonella sp.]